MSDSIYFESKQANIRDYDLMSGGEYSKKTNPKFIICNPMYKDSEPKNILYYLTYNRSFRDENNCINFSIKHFNKFESRSFVSILGNDASSGKTHSFLYYTSISDGSYWRFCINDSNLNAFVKGHNYVSSTFINIYLQKFINEQRSKFDELEMDNPKRHCVPLNSLNPYLHNRIMTGNNTSTNEFFTIMNSVFLQTSHVQYYKLCLKKLLKSLEEYTLIDQRTEIDICADIYCALKRQSLNKDITITTETSRRQFFTNIRDVFSTLFLKYFKLLIDTREFIFRKRFIIGEYRFDAIIYSIDIEYKLMSRKFYTLYYMIYTDSNRIRRKTFIHIIPKGTTISIWGLDERYVAAGPLISKVFDYLKQAPITVDRRYEVDKSENYMFIGDLTNYDFLPD